MLHEEGTTPVPTMPPVEHSASTTSLDRFLEAMREAGCYCLDYGITDIETNSRVRQIAIAPDPKLNYASYPEEDILAAVNGIVGELNHHLVEPGYKLLGFVPRDLSRIPRDVFSFERRYTPPSTNENTLITVFPVASDVCLRYAMDTGDPERLQIRLPLEFDVSDLHDIFEHAPSTIEHIVDVEEKRTARRSAFLYVVGLVVMGASLKHMIDTEEIINPYTSLGFSAWVGAYMSYFHPDVAVESLEEEDPLYLYAMAKRFRSTVESGKLKI